MGMHSNWEGFLRFNLISVPVRAYTATVAGGGKIAFHQIHKGCNSRIQYKKFCPIHGEVTKDDIVSGYEISKGEYVLVDPDELSKLRTENDKAINIDTFIRPDKLNPIYYGERSYYLVPSAKVGQKPYAVLQKVMKEQNRHAIGQVVMSGREQLVLVRSLDGLLCMTTLHYDSEIKKPSAFEDEAPEVEIAQKEMDLAENLVQASTADDFDFSRYQDKYTDQVRELIEAKAAGRKIVAPRAQEEPHVINLMDALRRSLDQVQKGGRVEKSQRVKRSHEPRPTPKRRRTG